MRHFMTLVFSDHTSDINPIVVLSRADEIEGDPDEVRKMLANDLVLAENNIYLLENYHNQASRF